MARSKTRPKQRISGGRYIDYRKKKLRDLAGEPTLTKVGPAKKKDIRMLGGSRKVKILIAETANVLDKKTKKHYKAKIITITESPANRHYVRRNIITKGSIIETDKGKARVTSRPGQEGTINAVLIG
jgi:small subunit ribosomal protein S8e